MTSNGPTNLGTSFPNLRALCSPLRDETVMKTRSPMAKVKGVLFLSAYFFCLLWAARSFCLIREIFSVVPMMISGLRRISSPVSLSVRYHTIVLSLVSTQHKGDL